MWSLIWSWSNASSSCHVWILLCLCAYVYEFINLSSEKMRTIAINIPLCLFVAFVLVRIYTTHTHVQKSRVIDNPYSSNRRRIIIVRIGRVWKDQNAITDCGRLCRSPRVAIMWAVHSLHSKHPLRVPCPIKLAQGGRRDTRFILRVTCGRWKTMASIHGYDHYHKHTHTHAIVFVNEILLLITLNVMSFMRISNMIL